MNTDDKEFPSQHDIAIMIDTTARERARFFTTFMFTIGNDSAANVKMIRSALQCLTKTHEVNFELAKNNSVEILPLNTLTAVYLEKENLRRLTVRWRLAAGVGTPTTDEHGDTTFTEATVNAQFPGLGPPAATLATTTAEGNLRGQWNSSVSAAERLRMIRELPEEQQKEEARRLMQDNFSQASDAFEKDAQPTPQVQLLGAILPKIRMPWKADTHGYRKNLTS